MTRADHAIALIQAAMAGKERILVAIDGPCASGKTTLAAELSARLSCPVIHMDHFFLRPEQRTPERLAEPGGNLDRERFAKEVLAPLREGKDVSYRPFVCSTMTLGEPISIPHAPVTVIEGSYSCHPDLRESYDLCLFTTIDPAEQEGRLLAREGEAKLEVFKARWIPMEEAYFKAFDVPAYCRVLEDTDGIVS